MSSLPLQGIPMLGRLGAIKPDSWLDVPNTVLGVEDPYLSQWLASCSVNLPQVFFFFFFKRSHTEQGSGQAVSMEDADRDFIKQCPMLKCTGTVSKTVLKGHRRSPVICHLTSMPQLSWEAGHPSPGTSHSFRPRGKDLDSKPCEGEATGQEAEPARPCDLEYTSALPPQSPGPPGAQQNSFHSSKWFFSKAGAMGRERAGGQCQAQVAMVRLKSSGH